MEIKKVVIPVAGKGTRFLPATKEVPKEMIPIINKPMIQYVVDEAVLWYWEVICNLKGKGGD